jgi:uracil-DNA glycosylase
MQDELFDRLPANALQQWPPQPLSDPVWQRLWAEFAGSEAGRGLDVFLHESLKKAAVVFPDDPLRALRLTPFDKVRVLILGQDPYHGAGLAHGLAFSVAAGTRAPPSLRHILQERARDLGPLAGSGPQDHLEAWAAQGVLLLNTVLTVEQGQAASHAKRGWEVFTSSVVGMLKHGQQPTVFMAWGAHAQALCVDLPARHVLLSANHPSPLSARRPPRPFLGCGHFSAANAWLSSRGQMPIHW